MNFYPTTEEKYENVLHSFKTIIRNEKNTVFTLKLLWILPILILCFTKSESDYYVNYSNKILPSWNTGEIGMKEMIKKEIKIKGA